MKKLPVPHFELGDVGSTNDEAFALAETHTDPIFVVTAKRQLQGRGRRGRYWVSEPGNLYASFFLRAPAEPDKLATLSFVAAVSLREAIGEFAPSIMPCSLKWPNDVLWSGAKIAGILLEAREQAGRLNVVVGLGVNCMHSPDEAEFAATNLLSNGIDCSPQALIAPLATRFIENVHEWCEGNGFRAIRDKWLAYAYGLKEPLNVRLETGELTGTFTDLDHDGALILTLSSAEQRTISAGDVFFRPVKG